MITLKQMASTHIDRFAGGDQHTFNELSYQEVIFNIRSICNEMLKTEYIGKYKEGDRSAITNCIASYELTLANDGDCGYITLPEFYLSLPYNRGVHRIFQRALKAQGNPTQTEFTLVHTPATSLKTRTSRYPGMNYCWIEGLKVKFYNLYAESGKTNVIITQLIVAAPDIVAENDPLPILPEMVGKIYDRLAQMELNPALKIDTTPRK